MVQGNAALTFVTRPPMANTSSRTLRLLSLLLIPVVRNGWQDHATKVKLFNTAQDMGVHLLPVHFYSPLPNTSEVPVGLGEQRFDLG